MIIKAGTIGVWNTVNPTKYLAKPGAKVIVTADCDTAETSLVQVKWIDELATGARRTGDIGRQNDGGYYHEDFIWEDAPVYDVNKTVEVAVATSELSDYIMIGQLLEVLPLFDDTYSNWFTRAYLQDACYCKYGWTVSESNKAIDLCVEKKLFKLV